jgi:hypothetical protein
MEWSCLGTAPTKEAFVSHATHANAALTPRARLRLARLIVDCGWPPARAAERYDVSWKTAKKWADRYEAEGPAGMSDRSSRPHHQPNRTAQPVVRKIVHLRWKQRLGPVEIGDRLGMASSTVHAVLVRCRINRLTHIDRVTGEPIRRYEHEKPGDLLHVDVKKLGKVPDGGSRQGLLGGRGRGVRQHRRVDQPLRARRSYKGTAGRCARLTTHNTRDPVLLMMNDRVPLVSLRYVLARAQSPPFASAGTARPLPGWVSSRLQVEVQKHPGPPRAWRRPARINVGRLGLEHQVG